MATERLKPQLALLSEEYVLVQAWKKTASYMRYHNWYADTLELDHATVNLPRFLASGDPVAAELLVLPGSMSVTETKDILYCRETGKPRSGRSYKGGTGPDGVLICDQEGFCWIVHVLHTDINPNGKIQSPDPAELARALSSYRQREFVAKRKKGRYQLPERGD